MIRNSYKGFAIHIETLPHSGLVEARVFLSGAFTTGPRAILEPQAPPNSRRKALEAARRWIDEELSRGVKGGAR